MGKKKIKLVIIGISLLVMVVMIACGCKQVIQDRNGNVFVPNKANTEYYCKKKDVKVNIEDDAAVKKIVVTAYNKQYNYEVEPLSSSDITSVHVSTSGREKTYTFDKTKHVIINIENDTNAFDLEVIDITTVVRMGLGDTRALAIENIQLYIVGLIFVLIGGLGICFHRELAILDNYIASMFYEIVEVKKPTEVMVFLIFIAFAIIYGIGLYISASLVLSL